MPRGAYEVTSAMVAYHGETKGYLATSVNQPNAPGVIMIHEWWGLNAHIKDAANKLASHGYSVLAVDMYNGTVAANATIARGLSSSVTMEGAIANLADANAYLRNSGSEKVASLGYCFGGGQSMNLGISSVPVDASVVYYGSLKTALADPEKVHAPLLLIYGTADTVTPLADAQELQTTLQSMGAPVELYSYEGLGHAFANPSNAGHDKNATRDAWDKTLLFLAKQLN